MSWDILIQDLPQVQSVSEIPDDFSPRPLGSRSDMIARIIKAVPGSDFSDPSWGLINGDSWSIEVNIGTSEPCDSVMLHVRGAGNAVATVVQIIDCLDARALDMQTGEFFDEAAARGASVKWQAYRDSVITNALTPDPTPPKRGIISRLFR